MSSTLLAQVNDQIGKIWSPMFTKELRSATMLAALVNKDYQGSINQLNDTVYVSQISAPTGELRTAGVDADKFNSEQLVTSRISIQANKRAVAAHKFEDLVQLQSQIGAEDSEIRAGLMYAIEKQVNDYLYSLVAPSTSAPDHTITGVTDFNATQLSAARTLAAQAKWLKNKGWWALLDPQYYGDLLNAQTMTSADYAPDAPVIGGEIAKQRFGYNILEDNSRSADTGLLFHPDFLHLVMQQAPRFKVSDLHPNEEFAYVISCDLVFGAALGIDGAKKHITVTA